MEFMKSMDGKSESHFHSLMRVVEEYSRHDCGAFNNCGYGAKCRGRRALEKLAAAFGPWEAWDPAWCGAEAIGAALTLERMLEKKKTFERLIKLLPACLKAEARKLSPEDARAFDDALYGWLLGRAQRVAILDTAGRCSSYESSMYLRERIHVADLVRTFADRLLADASGLDTVRTALSRMELYYGGLRGNRQWTKDGLKQVRVIRDLTGRLVKD